MKGLVFREFQNQPIIQGRESHPILYLTPSPNKNTKTKLFGSKFVFFFFTYLTTEVVLYSEMPKSQIFFFDKVGFRSLKVKNSVMQLKVLVDKRA